MSDTEKIFTRIYARNRWQNAESKSGPGSTAARTELLRSQLGELLRELGIRSLLDIPCGDFNWMRFANMPQIEYTGADIVPELVRENTLRHGGPGRKFIQADITRGPLPQSDLVLCRDGLVHLAFSDIQRALQAIMESGSTYLLLTTFTSCGRNIDVPAGHWRPLNFERDPFRFPPALRTVVDGPGADRAYRDKVLALYRLDGIPGRLKYSTATAAYQRTVQRLQLVRERMRNGTRRVYARLRRGGPERITLCL